MSPVSLPDDFCLIPEFNNDLLLCVHGKYYILSDLSKFPILSAKIDPPVMNITHVNGSLLVNLHAPNLPYRDQEGENVSMEYYELVYRVFIFNNSLEKVSSDR